MKFLRPLCLLFPAMFLMVPLCAQSFKNLMKTANKQYELHAFNQAIATYTQALEKRSDDPEALGNLADCYRILNFMHEASKYYVRAMAQKNVESRHILNYAHVLKAVGRYEEAKRWYQEYAKDDPFVGNHYAKTCDFALAQQAVDLRVTLKNENINSDASDFGPAFNQQQVVFSSSRMDVQRPTYYDNQSGDVDPSIQQPNQLYVARRGTDGYLENPLFLLGSDTQRGMNKGPVSFTQDGQMVAYTKNNFVNGTRHIPESGMKLDIYFATPNPNDQWVGDRPFPYNGAEYSTGFPCFSPDGTALYFASNRPDGYGGYDIYVSYRTGNSWGRPENLGPVINSPGDEVSPFFDGEQLFFASDWHPGFGGYDMFRAEQANNRWTRILHLGKPLSSSRDDYGLIYDSFRNIGYFVSNRDGGEGNLDIYSVTRPAENIVLQVTNASDGTPVAHALLDFSNCDKGLEQADERGIYQFQAVDQINCNVIIRKEGFVDKVVPLVSSGQSGSRQENIQLVRRGDEYYGKVLDYNTRLPVANVTITAVNQAAGNSNQVMTDVNGDYSLALSPNSNYVIRYSAPGYRDINRTVQTNTGNDPSLLSTISILPSDSPLPPGTNDPNQVINPYAPEGGGTATALSSGYAVQVAALNQPSVDRFSDLENLGAVYSKNEGGRYKIRVGVYDTKDQASQILSAVKDRGYSQAFVVAEDGIELNSQGQTPNYSQFTNTGGGSVSSKRYKIQLGAYSNPRNFNPSRISNLGSIEERQKGNLTVKYLAGYDSLSEARARLQQVRTSGFSGAFIVENVGGELKRVE